MPNRKGPIMTRFPVIAMLLGVLWISTSSLTAIAQVPSGAGSHPIAIVGGTLIDVLNFGHGASDITDSTIIVRNGRIESVGDTRTVKIPAKATVINAAGTYVIPGLIDGFGSMRTEGFAEAYLYEGVTTVFTQLSPQGQDGEVGLYSSAVGAVVQMPDVLRGEMIGGYAADGTASDQHPWTSRRLNDRRLTEAEILRRVDQIVADGARGILVGFDMWPDQLDVVVREAHVHNLIVMGEMAFTTYPYAVRAGVDALLRSDRYETAIDLPLDWLAYSDDPMGPGGAPGYRGVCDSGPESAQVAGFGKQLADAHTALMPMLSIEANADDLDIPNPWTLRSALFVKPSELDDPVDPTTGAHPYLIQKSARAKALRACAFHREALDGKFHSLGAHYLAGSASPAFGTMPGGGLHGEISLLQRIGLTPREALAAATWNFSEIYGWRDRGLIADGRRADIVLLAQDPRVDVSALEAIKLVMLRGSVVDRDRLANAAKERKLLSNDVKAN